MRLGNKKRAKKPFQVFSFQNGSNLENAPIILLVTILGTNNKVTVPPRGVHRVSSDGAGDDRMGAKIKTQKNPLRASNKTQKIPGQKINPQKIPCQISKP